MASAAGWPFGLVHDAADGVPRQLRQGQLDRRDLVLRDDDDGRRRLVAEGGGADRVVADRQGQAERAVGFGDVGLEAAFHRDPGAGDGQAGVGVDDGALDGAEAAGDREHRGVGVDEAVAVGVVLAGRAQVMRRVHQHLLDGDHVDVRVRRTHQRHHAGHVRAGHRRAVHVLVAAAGRRAVDAHAGRRDFRLHAVLDRAAVGARGAAAREAGDGERGGVVGRADGEGAVERRRAVGRRTQRGRARAFVARREHDHRTGRLAGVHHGPPAAVAIGIAEALVDAPGVLHHVGHVVHGEGVAVGIGEPLEAVDHVAVEAAARALIDDVGRDPLGRRGDADGVVGGQAGHGAGAVGAVAVAVAGELGVGAQHVQPALLPGRAAARASGWPARDACRRRRCRCCR